MRIVANLEKIITLTASQYQTLVNGNSITNGGKTYNFDANALYVVPEETIALSDIDGTTDLQAIENLTGTSGFLKKTNDTWSLDTNTYLTSVPLAANGTRGGAQIGYTTDATNHNYAVQLSNEKMYVNVPWTDNDTKVTSATNHYTPSTVSGQDKTASASGATAAWGIDVVQGITINTDGKGHITELNVTSGKIPANPNTDSKLAVAAVTSGTTYYPIVGTGTTAATRQYDTTGFVYKGTNGTTSVVGSAQLTLGNSTASGTANNKQGKLILYGSTAYAHTISGAPTAARTLSLPDKSGTIAVTDDIPDVSGKIDTAGTGLSKTGTTLNHSNSVTAQSTQAIYPIKIDAQGHISGYGTAVTPVTSIGGLTGDVTLADLGLSSAMTYKGSLSSLPSATSSTTYNTYAAGDVITISSSGKEYVYNKGTSASNSSWVELGDESSYKIKQTAISDSTGTADGTNTSTTFVYSFSQDADGVVSTKTRALPEASSSTKGITTVGASGGAATYGHTHTLSIASGGTSPTALAANTTYTLTAGGSTYVFTTPADTTYSAEKGISLSSGKFGHSNTAITAQSTQAIYPIKIDAYGHITAYGTAVTPLTAASTLDATKLSGTIPSGCYTDEKVKQNSSTTSAAYKLLMTTAASPTSGNTYETNYSIELSYNPSTKVLKNGTITLTTASSTTANDNAYDVLSLGNSTNVTSTTAHSEGKINIYSAATKSHIIVGKSTTTDYTHTLPNQTGLLVTLNSASPSADVGSTTKPVYVSSAGVVTEATTYAGGTAVTLNGTSAAGSTASFYAPTGAGSSGQYLKSSGSGAPSWTTLTYNINGAAVGGISIYAPTSSGTSGQYLKSNGSTKAPTWADLPAAVSVTSSGSGNVVTGMSVTNNAITYTLGTVSTVSAQIVRW